MPYEHGKILKKLMRELIDPRLATRLSGMFVNQRTLIEYENAEKRIAELEALLEKLGDGKVVPLKAVHGHRRPLGCVGAVSASPHAIKERPRLGAQLW